MPRISAEYRASQRQLVLDAAVRCFARKGIHRASMQDIFSESGLSAGAVYSYFAGKAEIISAIAEQRRSGEEALLTAAFAGGQPVDEALSGLVDALLDWFATPREQEARRIGLQVWAEALWNDEVRSIVLRGAAQRQHLTRALAGGDRAAAGMEPDAIARVLLAILQGLMVQQAWEPDAELGPVRPVIRRMIAAVLEEPEARARRWSSRR